MSHIPNSAMPHAGTIMEDDQDTHESYDENEGWSLRERAGDLTGKVRENPAAMFAFGAAAAAGAIAAVLRTDLFRSNNNGSSKRSSGNTSAQRSGSSNSSNSSGSPSKSGSTSRAKSGTGTTAQKKSGSSSSRSRSKKTSS